MRASVIKRGTLLALGAFAGGFFCARETAREPSCVAEAVTETVTLVRTVQAEAERSETATERVIERRIAVPCRCPKVEISKTETPTARDINVPSKDQPSDGILVLDERIVERAFGTTEKLKIGAFSGAATSDSSVRESAPQEASTPARWRVSAMAGYDWTDAVPVYGLAAGMRLVGPVELGVWATVSQRLHGAAGVSVSAAW